MDGLAGMSLWFLGWENGEKLKGNLNAKSRAAPGQ